MSLPWIDWELAGRTAARLVPPGPRATRAERAECVADLRAAALRAPALVSEATGLPLASGGLDLVLDRPRWAQSMVQTAPALWEQLGGVRTPTLGGRVKGRAAATQLGAGLAVLGTRILGQFEPFADPSRLLLVAPNVMLAERQMGVEPRDFRQWVCLHEQTHRVQFEAAPWLPTHLLALVSTVLAAEERADERVLDILGRLGRDASAAGDRFSNGMLMDLLAAPGARTALDRAMALMTLLEGHADVVMDLAGPEVIPSLGTIRRRFEGRRDSGGRHALVGRLVGMDAKLAQYRDGVAFCRAVIDSAGHRAMNKVFEGPENLPTRAELENPAAWLARIL